MRVCWISPPDPETGAVEGQDEHRVRVERMEARLAAAGLEPGAGAVRVEAANLMRGAKLAADMERGKDSSASPWVAVCYDNVVIHKEPDLDAVAASAPGDAELLILCDKAVEAVEEPVAAPRICMSGAFDWCAVEDGAAVGGRNLYMVRVSALEDDDDRAAFPRTYRSRAALVGAGGH